MIIEREREREREKGRRERVCVCVQCVSDHFWFPCRRKHRQSLQSSQQTLKAPSQTARNAKVLRVCAEVLQSTNSSFFILSFFFFALSWSLRAHGWGGEPARRDLQRQRRHAGPHYQHAERPQKRRGQARAPAVGNGRQERPAGASQKGQKERKEKNNK